MSPYTELRPPRLRELRAALEHAEEVRRTTLSRCHEFRLAQELELDVYRTQRAWRVMLWLRKAYALSRGSSAFEKLRLVKFLAASLAGKANSDDFELTFPSLASYIPEAMMEPFWAEIGPHSAASVHDLEPGERFPVPTAYDIVVLSIIDFDFRFQRPQQLAAAFADKGHRVFWVSPSRFLSPSSQDSCQISRLRDNIWEVKLAAPSQDIYRVPLSAVAAQHLRAGFREFYTRCGVVESCVLVQLPFWRSIAATLRDEFCSWVIYDCMDDWDTFPGIGEFNVREEAFLAQECDVLVVSAERLDAKFRSRGLRPVIVRNGADFEFFSAPGESSPALSGIARPIVGYFGAIADWIDLDLVAFAAKARPEYSFVLVGEVFGRDLSGLCDLPNFHLLGNRAYTEMPELLRSYDVCTIPFVLNQVTHATDPVKLYEYLSQGKPVVASRLNELEGIKDLIYLAAGPEEFVSRLDEAVQESRIGGTTPAMSRRIAFARENTWTSRRERLHQAACEKLPLVSVLILSYNSRDYIEACLESVCQRTTYPCLEVTVVDNGSTDGTREWLENTLKETSTFRLIALNTNIGFAAGNNLAVSQAQGSYFVFLNADTIVTPAWIGRMLRHFRDDAAIGLAGPMTNFAGNELKIDVDYQGLDDLEAFSHFNYHEYIRQSFDIAVVPLFCGFVPRHVWETTGPLDERFEVGMFEDDDFAIRVRNAGFRVIGARDCFVHHFGQGSFRQLSQVQYQEIFERNRSRFEQKWGREWIPHTTTPDARPPACERRYRPAEFSASARARVRE